MLSKFPVQIPSQARRSGVRFPWCAQPRPFHITAETVTRTATQDHEWVGTAFHNTFPLIGYLLLRMSMRKSSKGKSITRGWRQRAADHGIKTVDAGGERPDIVWGQHKREVKTTIVILGRREVLVKPGRLFCLTLGRPERFHVEITIYY